MKAVLGFWRVYRMLSAPACRGWQEHGSRACTPARPHARMQALHCCGLQCRIGCIAPPTRRAQAGRRYTPVLCAGMCSAWVAAQKGAHRLYHACMHMCMDGPDSPPPCSATKTLACCKKTTAIAGPIVNLGGRMSHQHEADTHHTRGLVWRVAACSSWRLCLSSLSKVSPPACLTCMTITSCSKPLVPKMYGLHSMSVYLQDQQVEQRQAHRPRCEGDTSGLEASTLLAANPAQASTAARSGAG